MNLDQRSPHTPEVCDELRNERPADRRKISSNPALKPGAQAQSLAQRRTPSEFKRVALYVRVSTDHQTIKNQERELAAVAERHGWEIVATFKDQGISGAKGRDVRPGLDKLLQAVVRKEFDLVAAWSVDRIGRSLIDLVGTLEELHSKLVDLYLHQQGIDTTTPSGKAMFQMMGVFAEFERSMLRERANAGLASARFRG